MGAPNFGLIGTAERYKELVLGSLETAVKKVETVKNAGESEVTYTRGTILTRGTDGKYIPLEVADIDTATTAFPAGVCSVLAEDITVPAEDEKMAQMVVKAEVAEDLLILETTAWDSLIDVVRVKARNILNASGIIPGKVKR